MSLKVDLSMSNLKLIVPPDWRVDCRIDRNSAGNIKDRGPVGSPSANRIVVYGALSMSNIIVKRRDPNRRGFFVLLFGRLGRDQRGTDEQARARPAIRLRRLVAGRAQEGDAGAVRREAPVRSSAQRVGRTARRGRFQVPARKSWAVRPTFRRKRREK